LSPAAERADDAPRGLFVGLTTVDLIFSLASFPAEDTKNTARNYAAAAGGPASNAAVAFSHLGGTAHLASSLGTSSVADIAKRDLESCGVQHVDLTPLRNEDPALSAIAVAANTGSRTILTSPAIDDDLNEPVEQALWRSPVDTADVVLLDGHQPNVAYAVAKHAKAAGKPVVLDGDLHKGGLESILSMVDIVIFGKSFSIAGSRDTSQLLEYFALRGPSQIIATNGAQPIELMVDGSMDRIEVEPVSAVDTLAAGDFFHGAFCYAIARGSSTRDALDLACEVASRSVTEFGTRAWMQERD
jgi:sugar/nucleoside kinase (ribokinase family)